MAKDLPLPPSAFAVVTDIHGDARALARVLDAIRSFDVEGGLLVCGDLLLSYRPDVDPVAALDLLLDQKIIGAVAGNTDRWFVDGTLESYEPHDDRGHALKDKMMTVKARLGAKQRDFLAKLPRTVELEVPGGPLVATHASPLGDEQGLTLDLSAEALRERLAGTHARYLVTGHLHRAFTRVMNGFTHFAVGAVSRHPYERPSPPEFAIVAPLEAGVIFSPQVAA
jgi:predicted phosphodiesterase